MFKSNAFRSCVELHEIEISRFCETREAFRVSGTPLPETADPAYQFHRLVTSLIRQSPRTRRTSTNLPRRGVSGIAQFQLVHIHPFLLKYTFHRSTHRWARPDRVSPMVFGGANTSAMADAWRMRTLAMLAGVKG